MHCSRCKTELSADSLFCSRCGARVRSKPVVSTKSSGSNRPTRVTSFIEESMFQKPDIDSPVICQLNKGDILSIINEEAGFYYAALETGEQRGLKGYVGMWAVFPPETEEQQSLELTTSVNTQNREARTKETKKTQEKNVNIRYTGSGADILWNMIGWGILSVITLGIYSAWAVNNLYRYIIEHIEVEIQ